MTHTKSDAKGRVTVGVPGVLYSKESYPDGSLRLVPIVSDAEPGIYFESGRIVIDLPRYASSDQADVIEGVATLLPNLPVYGDPRGLGAALVDVIVDRGYLVNVMHGGAR